MGASETLSHIDLFSVLTQEELAVLAQRTRRVRFPKGAVIFLAGDAGTCLYVVEEGHVNIVLASGDGKQMVTAVRGEGEFFGDMALLDGEPRSADAVAAEACQLLILDRADFVHFIENHPLAAVRLLAVLSRRLRESMRQQHNVTLRAVSARIADLLLRMAEEQGTPLAGGTGAIGLTSRLTQSELANLVGITRESMNKWLRYYEQRGVIARRGRQIVILRPDALRMQIT